MFNKKKNNSLNPNLCIQQNRYIYLYYYKYAYEISEFILFCNTVTNII